MQSCPGSFTFSFLDTIIFLDTILSINGKLDTTHGCLDLEKHTTLLAFCYNCYLSSSFMPIFYRFKKGWKKMWCWEEGCGVIYTLQSTGREGRWKREKWKMEDKYKNSRWLCSCHTEIKERVCRAAYNPEVSKFTFNGNKRAGIFFQMVATWDRENRNARSERVEASRNDSRGTDSVVSGSWRTLRSGPFPWCQVEDHGTTHVKFWPQYWFFWTVLEMSHRS